MPDKDPLEVLQSLQIEVAQASPERISLWEKELSRWKTPLSEGAKLVPPTARDAIRTIVDNVASNKYIFSILLTAIIKKISSPKQDIRIGQDRMPGGYSNRSLDQRV